MLQAAVFVQILSSTDKLNCLWLLAMTSSR